jgi:hypothetical protein
MDMTKLPVPLPFVVFVGRVATGDGEVLQQIPFTVQLEHTFPPLTAVEALINVGVVVPLQGVWAIAWRRKQQAVISRRIFFMGGMYYGANVYPPACHDNPQLRGICNVNIYLSRIHEQLSSWRYSP